MGIEDISIKIAKGFRNSPEALYRPDISSPFIVIYGKTRVLVKGNCKKSEYFLGL